MLRTSLLQIDIDLLTTNPTASPLFPYLTIVTVALVANTLFRLTRTYPSIPFHVPVPEGKPSLITLPFISHSLPILNLRVVCQLITSDHLILDLAVLHSSTPSSGTLSPYTSVDFPFRY